MATSRWSIEHEYTRELFSVDHLQHPLLRDIPCGEHGSHDQYAFTSLSLQRLRSAMISGEFADHALNTICYSLTSIVAFISNLATSIRNSNDHPQLIVLNETGRSQVRALLEAARTEYEVSGTVTTLKWVPEDCLRVWSNFLMTGNSIAHSAVIS